MGSIVGSVVGFGGILGDVENHIMTRTHVILPDDVVTAIDELVGQRGRSSFLTDAAREALKRRRLKTFLDSEEVAWKTKDHPELAQGAAAYVANMRQEGESSDGKRRGY